MPPSGEPLRERVLAAVAALLAAIETTSPPGEPYWTTPLVDRDLVPTSQYRTHLDGGGTVLGVVPIGGSETNPNERPLGFLAEYRFGVRGYVKATSGVKASTWMERLWQDHVVALLADETLGGLVIDCIPDGPRDTDDGEDVPSAEFAQPWKVTFLERF